MKEANDLLKNAVKKELEDSLIENESFSFDGFAHLIPMDKEKCGEKEDDDSVEIETVSWSVTDMCSQRLFESHTGRSLDCSTDLQNFLFNAFFATLAEYTPTVRKMNSISRCETRSALLGLVPSQTYLRIEYEKVDKSYTLPDLWKDETLAREIHESNNDEPFSENHHNAIVTNALRQVVYTLAIMQEKAQTMLMIEPRNIFIKLIERHGTFGFRINKKMIILPNLGFVVKIVPEPGFAIFALDDHLNLVFSVSPKSLSERWLGLKSFDWKAYLPFHSSYWIEKFKFDMEKQQRGWFDVCFDMAYLMNIFSLIGKETSIGYGTATGIFHSVVDVYNSPLVSRYWGYEERLHWAHMGSNDTMDKNIIRGARMQQILRRPFRWENWVLTFDNTTDVTEQDLMNLCVPRGNRLLTPLDFMEEMIKRWGDDKKIVFNVPDVSRFGKKSIANMERVVFDPLQKAKILNNLLRGSIAVTGIFTGRDIGCEVEIFAEDHLLGKGFRGSVYAVTAVDQNTNKSFDAALKILRVDAEDLSCPLVSHNIISCDEDVNEIFVSMIVSSLFERNISPAFVQFFNAVVCKGNESTENRQVQILTEKIHGDMKNVEFMIGKIQSLFFHDTNVKLEQLPTKNDYINNLTAQIVLALYLLQSNLGGMHNDLHLGNIFIKFADESIYANQPLKEMKYIAGKVAGKTFKIPNIGLIAKIGDWGHASLSLQRGGKEIGNVGDTNRIVYTKFLSDDTIAESAQLLAEWLPDLGVTKKITGADIVKNWSSVLEKRKKRLFSPASDLAMMMNHMAIHPFFFDSEVVQAYKEVEISNHMETYGHTDHMQESVLNRRLLGMDVLKIGNLEQLTEYMAHYKALTTPEQFLNHVVFRQFVDYQSQSLALSKTKRPLKKLRRHKNRK